MLAGLFQTKPSYDFFFAVVCLYCYGSIVRIAYLYKVDHQHWIQNHSAFKFQLRAHAQLIIPLNVTWNNRVIFLYCPYLIICSKSSFKDVTNVHFASPAIQTM